MAARALVEVSSHFSLSSRVLFPEELRFGAINGRAHETRAPRLCLRVVGKLDCLSFILYPAPLKRGRPSLIKLCSRARGVVGHHINSHKGVAVTYGRVDVSLRCLCGDDEHCCCVIRGGLEILLTGPGSSPTQGLDGACLCSTLVGPCPCELCICICAPLTYPYIRETKCVLIPSFNVFSIRFFACGSFGGWGYEFLSCGARYSSG